jgi:hypothetical protein
VEQFRNANDYVADLDSEQPLYAWSEALVAFLLQWKSPRGSSSLPARIERLYADLYERAFVESRDVTLVQAWLLSLAKAGYRFPEPLDRRDAPCRGKRQDLQLFLPTVTASAGREFTMLVRCRRSPAAATAAAACAAAAVLEQEKQQVAVASALRPRPRRSAGRCCGTACRSGRRVPQQYGGGAAARCVREV